ncbi:phage tail assembly chaperone [Massilia sp. TN1-12]|uniref:phage tail assembly chaperone n=1 Tax=Massilia paldalensis TaxID=3377675 RepID=UPI00384EBEC2
MAQKIKLGSRPKTFARTVTFPMLEGGEGSIALHYKYRTRKEMAELIDELQAASHAQAEIDAAALKAKADKGESIDSLKQIDFIDRELSLKVDYVLQIVDSWSLDEKLERASVEQLADELPAALGAIVEDYRKAINEGRLGN